MKDIKYSLPIGTTLKAMNEYTITEVLGQGGFGITYIATAKVKFGNINTTAPFAIKEFFLKEKCKRASDGITLVPMDNSFAKEVDESLKDFIIEGERINKLCQADEHIVNVNEVFTANNTAYFVMEYIDGGNLDEYVERKGKLSEKEAKEIIFPIAEAIGKMHKERILHLDIKPENIMMKKMSNGYLSPVIIDFGIAMHFNVLGKATVHSKNKFYSAGYSPIEQYGSINSFTTKVDVYALGATLFFMLTGKTPRQAFDVTPEYLEENLKGKDDIVKAAIMHAMTKDVLSRTDSPAEFIKELSSKKKDVVRKPTKKIPSEQLKRTTAKLTEDNETLLAKIGSLGNGRTLKAIGGVALVAIFAIGIALVLPGKCSRDAEMLAPYDSIDGQIKNSAIMNSDSLTAKKTIKDAIVDEPAKKSDESTKVDPVQPTKHDEPAKAEPIKSEEQKTRNARIQNMVKQAYSAAHSGDATTAKRLVNEIISEGGEWKSKGQAMKNEFKELGVYDFD